jgi:epsilon-lactone hydrolase
MPSPEMLARIEQIRPVLRDIPRAIDERRALGERMRRPTPQDLHIRAAELDEPAGEWVWGVVADGPAVVLHCHGGGYVAGSTASVRTLIADLSVRTGALFFSLDYRLAPENPFPAAVEDGIRAYVWLLSTGIPAHRIVLGGDSAGGGLAIATALAAAEAGHDVPAGVYAFSPFLDMTLTSASMTDPQSPDPVGSLLEYQNLVKRYLRDADPRHPHASPLFADLSGLPPVHLEAGEIERLVDDARRFATKALAAGVQVGITVTEGAIHNFPHIARDTPEAAAALDRVGAFIVEMTRVAPGIRGEPRELGARRDPRELTEGCVARVMAIIRQKAMPPPTAC